MADKSAIEWTDATWNPVRGCTRVSPGCGGPGHAGGCYAEGVAARFSDPGQAYHGFAERGRAGSKWTGKVALIESQLTLPLRWKKPRRIFVNSMSDLFHEGLPDEAIDRVFAIMALCPQHTFQVLTKRAERMRDWLRGEDREVLVWWAAAVHGDIFQAGNANVTAKRDAFPWPLPNVWLGVSVEDQPRADERIPLLLEAPAAVRFLSCEPLLGPVDLTAIRRTRAEGFMRPLDGRFSRIDWVIVGGESGPNARPMHPDWARSLRDECAAAGVPFFFKQWGEWAPFAAGLGKTFVKRAGDETLWLSPAGKRSGVDDKESDPPSSMLARVGKKVAGRRLDGREHNEFPETKETA